MSTEKEQPDVYTVVDEKLHPAIEKRVDELIKDMQKDVRGNHFHPLQWITGLILVLILGSNGFLYYQQSQQTQQINNLAEQLTPTTQLEPSGE
ncbi:hypothetical protein Lepto7375DRAFT_0191 [Leptolyngbya sp. PCC 7375]|nr:hypothetical protein Lepto7375DRAFT_0191 [Leptolyngbya sp. PCC 7375]